MVKLSVADRLLARYGHTRQTVVVSKVTKVFIKTKNYACIFMTIASSPAAADPSDWLRKKTAGMHKIVGTLTQEDNGFQITAPPSVNEFITNGVDGNHGVRMILGEHRKIDVYAFYTDPDWRNTKICGPNQFWWEKVSQRKQYRIRIDGKASCLLTFKSREVIWNVIQVKGNGDENQAMFTLLQTTTPIASRSDLALFLKISSSFRFTPVRP